MSDFKAQVWIAANPEKWGAIRAEWNNAINYRDAHETGNVMVPGYNKHDMWIGSLTQLLWVHHINLKVIGK